MTNVIMRTIGIDMGHRVPNHKTKCKNLHGHRYKIELKVHGDLIKTPGASNEGMVMDFGDMKTGLMEVIDAKFDHGFCMYQKDMFAPLFKILQLGAQIVSILDVDYEPQKIIFVDFIPTVENLSAYWYSLMNIYLLERNIKIKSLKVWETPNCWAEYSE